jgi:hypothetical protein
LIDHIANASKKLAAALALPCPAALFFIWHIKASARFQGRAFALYKTYNTYKTYLFFKSALEPHKY